MASFIPSDGGGSSSTGGGRGFAPVVGGGSGFHHQPMMFQQQQQQQQQYQQGDSCRRCGTVGCDVKVLDCGCRFHAVSRESVLFDQLM